MTTQRERRRSMSSEFTNEVRVVSAALEAKRPDRESLGWMTEWEVRNSKTPNIQESLKNFGKSESLKIGL